MTHGIGVLLLGAVAGYWVLERAETHKTALRPVGRFLGLLVILVSIASALCALWCPTGMSRSGKGLCPFMPKSAPPAPPQIP